MKRLDLNFGVNMDLDNKTSVQEAELSSASSGPNEEKSESSSVGLSSAEEKVFLHHHNNTEEGEIGEEEEEGRFRGPQFTPRLYKQRYMAVNDRFRQLGRKLRKVVDFGCAECRFLRRARRALPHVKDLVGVDRDRELLEEVAEDLDVVDDREENYFYTHRPSPLRIDIYEGDLTLFDRRLADVDAISCIELIEHLEEGVLAKVPEAVFSQYRPYIAVFTTPNQEFNVLFEMGPDRPFRHWDHKFEWTRKQFQEWCQDIVGRFPEYQVEFDGCGEPPEERKDVGCCSQMAIFQRKSWEEYVEVRKEKEKVAELGRVHPEKEPYEEVDSIDFPFDKTARIASELTSAVTRCCVEVACFDENIQKLPRDPDGSFLPVEEEEKDPCERKDVWNLIGAAEHYDKADNPVVEEVVGHELGIFIPMERIMQWEEVRKLCDDKPEVVAFLATHGWKFDFILNRLFYPLEELPETDEEEDEDFWSDGEGESVNGQGAKS